MPVVRVYRISSHVPVAAKDPSIDVGHRWRWMRDGPKSAGMIPNNLHPLPFQFEVTLEEFLIKAGVIKEESSSNRAPIPPSQLPLSPLQFSADCNSDGSSGHQVTSLAQPGVVEMHMMETGRMTGGKKCSAAVMTMEGLSSRRQKQIKNRESAAWSCARKQAYTEELEAELRSSTRKI